MSKKMLSLEDIEGQTALELPSRETTLVFVVIGPIASGNTIRIPVQNNQVALQVCAAVQALSVLVGQSLTCAVEKR